MTKKEADSLVTGGKLAMLDATTDASRALVAAVAFSKAVPYYEATGDADKVCDLEANIFWCKKHMTGESIKVLIEAKTGDDVFKKALDRVDALAAKEIPKSEAKAYYDRADKFAQEHPDDFEQISVRYFEVAERFAGTDISLQAQKVSLMAQQKQQKRVQAESEIQRQTLFTRSAPGGPGVQTATIPGADAMKGAVAAVRKLFKDDYAKSKPNQKRRLVAKLLTQAPLSKDDPNTQYAMLTEAIDLSLAIGDWYATFTACDLMAQEFKGVDARSKKKEVFAKARANPAVTAIVKLVDMPDDPESNAVAGKYFCFDAGKWDIGLPLLVRGNDAEYKAAADMEIVHPASAPQQLELADKWYALGKKAKPGARESMLARAFSWYKQAEPAITGITKQRIAGRIEEIDGLLPMTNLDYENLTPRAMGPPQGRDGRDLGRQGPQRHRHRHHAHPAGARGPASHRHLDQRLLQHPDHGELEGLPVDARRHLHLQRLRHRLLPDRRHGDADRGGQAAEARHPRGRRGPHLPRALCRRLGRGRDGHHPLQDHPGHRRRLARPAAVQAGCVLRGARR